MLEVDEDDLTGGAKWVFKDEDREGISASPYYEITSSGPLGYLGVESYDGTTLTFSTPGYDPCKAKIEGDVLTISGLEKIGGADYNGAFTKQ